ncbi:hypothetical protein SALBM217S_06257 [Streptomyces griseoloalbus]
MSSRTSPVGRRPVTIRRAVARDAKRLTRLVRGSGAYAGMYASAVAGYRVGPGYIESHRTYVAVGADEHGDRILGFYALVLAPPELDLLFVADEAQGGVSDGCSSRTCGPRPAPPPRPGQGRVAPPRRRLLPPRRRGAHRHRPRDPTRRALGPS